MSKSQPIPYKDTLAMPGSNLYKLLSEGKTKEAEKQYQETEANYRKLMGIEEKKDGLHVPRGHKAQEPKPA